MIVSPSYICASCGDIFDRTRPDDEAMAEARQTWEADDLTDAAIVCDDCYEAMVGQWALAATRPPPADPSVLLSGFLRLILHEVFDPILKAAATFVARQVRQQARAEHRRRHPKAHRRPRW